MYSYFFRAVRRTLNWCTAHVLVVCGCGQRVLGRSMRVPSHARVVQSGDFLGGRGASFLCCVLLRRATHARGKFACHIGSTSFEGGHLDATFRYARGGRVHGLVWGGVGRCWEVWGDAGRCGEVCG